MCDAMGSKTLVGFRGVCFLFRFFWLPFQQKNSPRGEEISSHHLGPPGMPAEVVLFLCETQAFLRSERRTDVALDSNQAGDTQVRWSVKLAETSGESSFFFLVVVD